MASCDQSSDNNDSQIHNQEFHRDSLTELCRLCSSRLLTFAKKRQNSGQIFSVQKYQLWIRTELGINTAEDIPDIHPTHFCNGCRNAIKNFKRNQNSHTNVKRRQDFLDVNCRWNRIGDNTSTCFTCSTYLHQTRKGRRAKQSPQTQPEGCTPNVDTPSMQEDTVDQSVVEQSQNNTSITSYSPVSLHQPLKEIQNSELIPPKEDLLDMAYKHLLSTSGPPTEQDYKALNHILDKFDKSSPLIEVKTGGQVGVNY